MKRKMLYCVLCVLVLASLSGCGKNKTPSNDRVNLKEYHQQYQQDTLEVKKSSYEKLDFAGCTFADLPDSDTVCGKQGDWCGGRDFSGKKMVERYGKYKD